MLWWAVAAAAEQATVDAHGEVSDAFDAALRLNAAEHDAQMEVACSHFFCGAAADYDVPPMSRHSMGPVQMLNDYSETLQGEDQIFVSEEPLFSPEECEEVIRLTELEGEGLPSSQSGKYKLGKAWIKDMPQVKEWFNEALRTKLFPTLAHLLGGRSQLRPLLPELGEQRLEAEVGLGHAQPAHCLEQGVGRAGLAHARCPGVLPPTRPAASRHARTKERSTQPGQLKYS